jgi:hypothetical protein
MPTHFSVRPFQTFSCETAASVAFTTANAALNPRPRAGSDVADARIDHQPSKFQSAGTDSKKTARSYFLNSTAQF